MLKDCNNYRLLSKVPQSKLITVYTTLDSSLKQKRITCQTYYIGMMICKLK